MKRIKAEKKYRESLIISGSPISDCPSFLFLDVVVEDILQRKEFLEVPYNNFGQPDFGLPVFFIP